MTDRSTLTLNLNKRNQEKEWAGLITPQAMGRPKYERDPGARDPERAWPILEIFLVDGSGDLGAQKVYAVPSERVLAWMAELSPDEKPSRGGFFGQLLDMRMSGRLSPEFLASWPKSPVRALTAAELKRVAKGEAFVQSLFLNGFKYLRWADHFIFSEAFYISNFSPAPTQEKPAPSVLTPAPAPARAPRSQAPMIRVAQPEKSWAFLQEKHGLLAPQDVGEHRLSFDLLNSFVEPEFGALSYLGEVLAGLQDNPQKAFTEFRQRLVKSLGLEDEVLSSEAQKKLKLLGAQSTPLSLQKNDLDTALNGSNWVQRLAAGRLYVHLTTLREIVVEQALGRTGEGDLLQGERDYLLDLMELDISQADGVRDFLAYFEQRPERMLDELLLTQDVLERVGDSLESLNLEVYRREQRHIAADQKELERRLLAIQDDVLEGDAEAIREMHMIFERAHNLQAAIDDWKDLIEGQPPRRQELAPFAETFEQLVLGARQPQPDRVYPVDHTLFPKMVGIQGVVFISQFTRKLSHLGPDDLRKVKALFADMTHGFVAERHQSGVKHHLPEAHPQFVLVKHKGGGGRHRLLGGFVNKQLVLVDIRLNEDPPNSGYSSISKSVCRMAQEAGYNCNSKSKPNSN